MSDLIMQIFSNNYNPSCGVTYVNSSAGITMLRGTGLEDSTKSINSRTKLIETGSQIILESVESFGFEGNQDLDYLHSIIFLKMKDGKYKALIIKESSLQNLEVLIQFNLDNKTLFENYELAILLIQDIITPFEFVVSDEHGYMIDDTMIPEYILRLLKPEV